MLFDDDGGKEEAPSTIAKIRGVPAYILLAVDFKNVGEATQDTGQENGANLRIKILSLDEPLGAKYCCRQALAIPNHNEAKMPTF